MTSEEAVLDVENRLGRLESKLESVEQSQGRLENDIRAHLQEAKRDFAAMRGDLATFQERLAERERPDWRTWAAIAGLVFLLVGAIGAALIAPLSRDVYALEKSTTARNAAQDDVLAAYRHELDDRLTGLQVNMQHELAGELAHREQRFQDRIATIMTRMDWMTGARNLRERNFDRLLGLLWKRAYGEELPPATLPDAGPP